MMFCFCTIFPAFVIIRTYFIFDGCGVVLWIKTIWHSRDKRTIVFLEDRVSVNNLFFSAITSVKVLFKNKNRTYCMVESTLLVFFSHGSPCTISFQQLCYAGILVWKVPILPPPQGSPLRFPSTLRRKNLNTQLCLYG